MKPVDTELKLPEQAQNQPDEVGITNLLINLHHRNQSTQKSRITHPHVIMNS